MNRRVVGLAATALLAMVAGGVACRSTDPADSADTDLDRASGDDGSGADKPTTTDGASGAAGVPAEDEFPLGVWFESVTGPQDIGVDRDLGLNTYVVLSNDSDLSLVERSGITFLAQQSEWRGTDHPAISGWELHDEIDMQRDPAAGCAELEAIAAGLPADGRLRFNNFGKGVAFWETDAEAACYVNLPELDIVSADTYWFTDEDICGSSEGGSWDGERQLTPDECHLAANYGRTVDRVRYLDALDGERKEVWAVVEVGQPFEGAALPPITPEQVRAAVWHSVIAGAEGIVYFNHSFGGPCPTQHALREPCYAPVRTMVGELNDQLLELGPVIAGTPVGRDVVSGPVRTTIRRDGSDTYIIAGATTAAGGTATFTVPGAARVEVLFEDRTLDVDGVEFTDSFADGNAVHIYRVTDS